MERIDIHYILYIIYICVYIECLGYLGGAFANGDFKGFLLLECFKVYICIMCITRIICIIGPLELLEYPARDLIWTLGY